MARRADAASTSSRVLVTGFDPFGGEPINPSLEVARRLHGWRSARGAVVRRASCRRSSVVSIEVLEAAIARTAPQLVIALGQASGRSEISIERVAINVDDARIADNAGRQPIDEPVVAGGPAAYFSTLPIKAIMRGAARGGHALPACRNTAGTFVCNHLFYGLAHLIATRAPHVRGGFIHLPLLPEQALRFPGASSLPLDTMVEAVRIAIETSLNMRTDTRLAAGAID